MSSGRRRTTTIRRSHAWDRLLLVLPGIVLLVGLVTILDTGGSRPDDLVFNNFATAASGIDGPATSGSRAGASAVAEGGRSVATPGANSTVIESVPVARGRYVVAVQDESGRPVVNARVTRTEIGRVAVAAAPDGGTEIFEPFAREELVTDENGEIAFDASDRGNRYELLVEVDGYAAKHYRLRDPGHRYALKLHRSARISGRVTDEDREPLADITVELWHDINRKVTARTDENGFYEFGSVTPTTATLRIHDSGFLRARQHVVVVEGRNQYFRDFILKRGGRLEARVVDPQGQPVRAAAVRLIELESGLVCGRVASDAAGLARFDCLAADRRYMAVALATRAGGRALAALSDELETTRIDIVTRPLWSFSGTVRTEDGLPLPGTQVIIESEAFDASSSTSKEQFVVTTDDEGRFIVPDLDPTLDYAALIYHQQFAMQQIAKVEPPASPETSFEPSALTAESSQEIVLEPAATMEGVIEGPDGKPLGDTVIYLSFEDDGRRELPGGQISIRTDAEGRFFIGNLGSGSYRFEAVHLSSGLQTALSALDIGTGETLKQRFLLATP